MMGYGKFKKNIRINASIKIVEKINAFKSSSYFDLSRSSCFQTTRNNFCTENSNNDITKNNISLKLKQKYFKNINRNIYECGVSSYTEFMSDENYFLYNGESDCLKEKFNLSTNSITLKQYVFKGRILVVRSSSNLIFGEIEVEPTKFIQIVIDKKYFNESKVNIDNIEDNSFALLNQSKIRSLPKAGDNLLISGYKYKTLKNNHTLLIKSLEIITTTNQHLPKYNHSKNVIKNSEVKYSKRYLDLMINTDSKNVLIKRHEIINYIRQFLISKDFIELETPTLSSSKSGAIATPFITKHEALKRNLFLRIAPEIHLKMLAVSGFTKIFEIGKNFRNEDISVRHNPEFTTCELYVGYWSYIELIAFTEDFIRNMFDKFYSKKIFDKDLKTSSSENIENNKEIDEENEIVDYSQFKYIDIIEELESLFNISDIANKSEKEFEKLIVDFYNKDKSKDNKNKENKLTLLEKLDYIITNYIEAKITKQPTFIIHHPVIISPLSKKLDSAPLFTERFEFYLNKMEIINAYSELTDHEDQRRRFNLDDPNEPHKNNILDNTASSSIAEANKIIKNKEKNNNDADLEFVDALSYGLPPTGGWGLGIDRLVMILLNQNNIKDVIAFPMMNRRV